VVIQQALEHKYPVYKFTITLRGKDWLITWRRCTLAEFNTSPIGSRYLEMQAPRLSVPARYFSELLRLHIETNQHNRREWSFSAEDTALLEPEVFRNSITQEFNLLYFNCIFHWSKSLDHWSLYMDRLLIIKGGATIISRNVETRERLTAQYPVASIPPELIYLWHGSLYTEHLFHLLCYCFNHYDAVASMLRPTLVFCEPLRNWLTGPAAKRENLLRCLKTFFSTKSIEFDWDEHFAAGQTTYPRFELRWRNRSTESTA